MQELNMNDNWSDSNHLAGSGSPYLEQHADNPVHWLPWGSDAFNEAKQLDRPVLVSIGYSTCHWCHVMARESFEDLEAAALMNKVLIPVKVDREQHPEVDAIYMEAAQRISGGGGWPLNVFATSEGRPFLAVTYLPTDRWKNLVAQVNQLWNTDRERIDEAASALSSQLQERDVSEVNGSATWGEKLRADIRKNYHPHNPGFAMGNSPMKFPPSQILDWLLEYGDKDDQKMALDILITMMDSGLHDRVGGGFHRYTVDSGWRVPHFEKMTYDNAQLMGLYARASMLSSIVEDDEGLSNDLLTAATGTADWFLREMRVLSNSGSGRFMGYATATDADDTLGEGSYFAWPPGALNEVLGVEDGEWIARRWNISGDGKLPPPSAADPSRPHSGEYEPIPEWIPHPRFAAGYPESYRNGSNHNSGDNQRSRELMLIEKLRIARRRRPAPARDDKVLTDQNALILEGFTRLARYGGGQIYQDAAIELANLLLSRMNTESEYPGTGDPPNAVPRLKRSEGNAAYITDYGYLSMALAGAYSLTGNSLYVTISETIAEEAVVLLAVGNGSFYTTPAGRQDLFKRAIEDFDGPSPAGSHALGIAFARLYTITGEKKWAEHADKLIRSRGKLAVAAPSFASSLIRIASARANPHTLVVAGPENHPDTLALLALCRRLAGPDMMVIAADQTVQNNESASDAANLTKLGGTPPSTDSSTPSKWTELEGRVGLERPQLLVCRDGSCLLPAFTLEEARTRLAEIRVI